ncbi:MAG: CAF17-like 4Fe-4S cluster assembly/insertion protein YgfZ [Planctomycetota bacterium]|jgi:folate-binding protein YgfZ
MKIAQTGMLVADGGDRAWIEMCGADAPDFLQRVCTSDVLKLQPGQGQWSAMLDGKGHWIADLLLYALPHPEEVPCFGIDLPVELLQVVLDKFEMMHFGEQMSWEAQDVARVLRLTAGATAVPEEFGVQAMEGGWQLQRPDRGLVCVEEVRVGLDPGKALAQVTAEGGNEVQGIGAEELEHLRIQAKRPRWGVDFDGATTLPNCNEWHRANIEKGCYAGQEVIAKINTYGEAPRQLCHLDFGEERADLAGAELQTAEGRRMGRVSSWAWSEAEQRASGLGMLRRKAAVEGGEVFAVLALEDSADGDGAGDKADTGDRTPAAEPVRGVVHIPPKVFG